MSPNSNRLLGWIYIFFSKVNSILFFFLIKLNESVTVTSILYHFKGIGAQRKEHNVKVWGTPEFKVELCNLLDFRQCSSLNFSSLKCGWCYLLHGSSGRIKASLWVTGRFGAHQKSPGSFLPYKSQNFSIFSVTLILLNHLEYTN